jgi:hypothetical protein
MGVQSPSVKLVLSFDLKAGTQQVYYQFMISQFVPAVQKMGLQMSDAWHTVYGKGPSRSAGFVGPDLLTMRQLLAGTEWRELESRLQEYAENYTWKIVPLRDGFQL